MALVLGERARGTVRVLESLGSIKVPPTLRLGEDASIGRGFSVLVCSAQAVGAELVLG